MFNLRKSDLGGLPVTFTQCLCCCCVICSSQMHIEQSLWPMGLEKVHLSNMNHSFRTAATCHDCVLWGACWEPLWFWEAGRYRNREAPLAWLAANPLCSTPGWHTNDGGNDLDFYSGTSYRRHKTVWTSHLHVIFFFLFFFILSLSLRQRWSTVPFVRAVFFSLHVRCATVTALYLFKPNVFPRGASSVADRLVHSRIARLCKSPGGSTVNQNPRLCLRYHCVQKKEWKRSTKLVIPDKMQG